MKTSDIAFVLADETRLSPEQAPIAPPLAQRKGTNVRTFRLYSTSTSDRGTGGLGAFAKRTDS